MARCLAIVSLLLLPLVVVKSWTPPPPPPAAAAAAPFMLVRKDSSVACSMRVSNRDAAVDDTARVVQQTVETAAPQQQCRRRTVLQQFGTSAAAAVLLVTTSPAHALVKGVAPPPPKSKSDRPKCTNLEECQAAAETREQQQREVAEAEAVPVEVTRKGTRYRDLTIGSGDATVSDGNDVKLYYKVLKLGKRSYDGLSGEGTVVFSRGYGYEDDEPQPRSRSFVTTVGSYRTIPALNDAVLGMKVGSLRRFAIQPDRGWRKPGQACDGGPGGSGAGGDLKTDYVVVPTATMVAAEACFDATKQPFPSSYAQQRRMAQRFDQSLIMEVEVVEIQANGTMQ